MLQAGHGDVLVDLLPMNADAVADQFPVGQLPQRKGWGALTTKRGAPYECFPGITLRVLTRQRIGDRLVHAPGLLFLRCDSLVSLVLVLGENPDNPPHAKVRMKEVIALID